MNALAIPISYRNVSYPSEITLIYLIQFPKLPSSNVYLTR